MKTCRVPVTYQAGGNRCALGLYLRAIRKYDIRLTRPIRATSSNKITFQSRVSGEGEVPAADIGDDLEYLIEVQIGTPPQTLKLDPDTGSSDTWVFSDLLTAKVASGATKFNHKESSTFKQLPGETWKISYGDGSQASGIVGTDVIRVGGISVAGQAIELANSASSQFLTGSDEGLLGLAWPSINTAAPKQVATVVENMISQELLENPLFAVKLVHNGTGEYTFGFIDEADVEGDISYTPVDNSQGFWQVASAMATIAGKSVNRPSGNTAIIDTGTTLMMCDDAFVDAVYAAIPGAKYDSAQGGYLVPTNATIPAIEVAIGTTVFQLPSEAIAFSSLGDGSGMSFGGIQSRGEMTFDIYGDVFIKYVLAIFDQGNQRFGCARRPDVTYA